VMLFVAPLTVGELVWTKLRFAAEMFAPAGTAERGNRMYPRRGLELHVIPSFVLAELSVKPEWPVATVGVMAILCVLDGFVLPHEFEATIMILPPLDPAVAEIEVVPWPLLMVQPAGTVQV